MAISIQAFAAGVSIEKVLPTSNDLKVGDEIFLDLSLRSEGVQYNAIEGSLAIPSIFEITKVVTGNSFVSVWLEDPVNFSEGTIVFSGIAPAGYNREVGQVFSVLLSAKAPGEGSIRLKNASLFRNDGKGTEEKIAGKSLGLEVRESRNGESPYRIDVKDVTAPEGFTIDLVHDPKLYDGRYAIIWNALDKGSGVASYDVIEGSRVFKQAKSPYVLEKQSLRGKIYVKAYDHEGNATLAVLVPPGKTCFGNSCYGLIDAGTLIIVIVIIYLLWRKRKQR